MLTYADVVARVRWDWSRFEAAKLNLIKPKAMSQA
jgi:hypothetical protein